MTETDRALRVKVSRRMLVNRQKEPDRWNKRVQQDERGLRSCLARMEDKKEGRKGRDEGSGEEDEGRRRELVLGASSQACHRSAC